MPCVTVPGEVAIHQNHIEAASLEKAIYEALSQPNQDTYALFSYTIYELLW